MTADRRRVVRLVIDGLAARIPGFTYRRITGYWEPVELEELKKGDIFRVYDTEGGLDPLGGGSHHTAVALADAAPGGFTGDDLRWGVRSLPVRGFKE